MVDRPWRTVARAGNREYLALVSFLPPKRRRTTFKFLRFTRAITAQLMETRGVVGFAFRAKILSRRFYTLSVWEDERSLMDFVGSEPHRGTMREMGPHMRETMFVRWQVRGSEVPPSWPVALEVLAKGKPRVRGQHP